jgi:peptidoglycan/xylan/chitin deacetylase (PgdA/CDA1 family)
MGAKKYFGLVFVSKISSLTVILLLVATLTYFGIVAKLSVHGTKLIRAAENSQLNSKDLATSIKQINYPLEVNIPDVETLGSQTTLAPVVSRIQTSQPVVFLSLDDGWVKNPEAHAWLIEHKYPITLFLTDAAIKDNYDYFKELQASGMTIENHTLDHPTLTKLNYDQQKQQICGSSDKLSQIYGQRPTLFRPPYGVYNEITQRVVAECGMKAVITWHAKVDGGSLQFQAGNHLIPGDIVLMHFRPAFMQDAEAFVKEVNSQNLVVGRLEDWLK